MNTNGTNQANQLLYEADEKLNNDWINENATSHEFSKGKGTVILDDSVTEIEFEAFRECHSLTSIVLPDSVTEIEVGTFDNCKALREPLYNAKCFAYFPNGYATEYRIPEGIEQIVGYAFKDCKSLTSIINYSRFCDRNRR